MKTFLPLLIICFLSVNSLTAQSTSPLLLQQTDSLRLRLGQIFAPLDKTQISTGYLAEYASPLLDLHFYNGILSDSNRTDLTVFHYLRATLASASINGPDTLPNSAQINARLEATQAAFPEAIPIVMQYMSYDQIRKDAVEKNLIQVQNNQVYDVANRPETPYEVKNLFVAAPGIAYSPDGQVSFVFNRNLHLSNNPYRKSTYKIAIDFGDGRGYQIAQYNQPISTNYSTPGIKRIKVKAYYFLATLESHFDFEVRGITVAYRYDQSQGFNHYFPPSALHSGGTAYVVYGTGNSNQQIRKPLIIAEGYNIADTAPHLVKCNNANNSIKDLLEKIGPIYTGSFDFNDKLHTAGYDIVYIDNAKGADDIRRNAALFEEVIRWVNEKKRAIGSQEQNVVIGQSMGGLVSRYGLAEMVRNPLYQNGINVNDPQTRLLILHDSPQRGANNPIGVQSMTRSLDVPFFLGRFSVADMAKESIGEVVKVLDRPATAQLSIFNAFNGRGDIRPNTFIDGQYQQMVNFNLYSSPYRPAYAIIAASDGSQCARSQNIQPRTVLTSTYGEAFFTTSSLFR